jgi:predicted TIM-barrel fold metal-dependent hydrolase
VTPDAKPFVVTLEEHYWDAQLLTHFAGREGKRLSAVEQRLQDLGELRLKEMDEAGIDLQVLSHGAPGAQKLDADIAVPLARETNDRLHEVVQRHPRRFAGFATLPTADPKPAADELERTVVKLGFKGAMVHGLTGGRLFLDDKRFWPIFERAQALDVPLYIHPSFPHPAVIEAYYQDYAAQYPELLGPALGFTVETKTQAIRLVLSGVLDAYPGVKIILGHLGETLPFMLWRIDQALSRPGNVGLAFKDTFRRHFYLTTSGNFSDSALLCSIMELGVERILFSVDWPFVSNMDGMKWMANVSLCAEDKAKILGGNARRLLRI